MVIAVDFDGTIVKDKWPYVGRLRFGAKWCLEWLKKRGHKLILWTCRNDAGAPYFGCGTLFEAVFHLNNNGITFDCVNENLPERVEMFNNDPRKVGADWYIDDKAGFLGWWSVPLIVLWLERREKRCKMKTVK